MPSSRPTLNHVAARAGVSRGTVSNVFTHPERVRPEIRERVEKAAQAIGYAGPDPRGRLLRAGKFGAIGFVIPGSFGFVNLLESPYGRDLVLGLSDTCDATGTSLTLIDGRPGTFATAVRDALVDGLIVGSAGDETIVAAARLRNMRVVVIDIGAGPDVPSVGIDAFGGAKAAAEHLLSLGHRRFAIVAVRRSQGPPIIHPAGKGNRPLKDGIALDREKMRGYRKALAAAGIDLADVRIIETNPWDQTVGAALFETASEATAVLAMSDRQAMTILREAVVRGISVPGEFSVVGFDGVAEGASTVPPLTTIRQPTREKARRAAELLLNNGALEQLVLPVELIVRASTAPPPLVRRRQSR